MKHISALNFRLCLALIVGSMITPLVNAKTPPPPPEAATPTAPCKTIENDCKHAGFAPGEAGQGTGLYMDCLCPLIAPNFPAPKKSALKLPDDKALAPACRTHPHGQHIMEKCAKMAWRKSSKAR